MQGCWREMIRGCAPARSTTSCTAAIRQPGSVWPSLTEDETPIVRETAAQAGEPAEQPPRRLTLSDQTRT